jgi:16S rRNA (guanine527-N7)-methyltransferase
MPAKPAPDIYSLLNQHVKIPHETFHRLGIYHDLLIKWQNSVNLVGPDTIGEAWRRHFLDALQLVNSIPDLSQTIIDLGSGAGFPGMVLAIAGASDMHLVESDGKKITFLKEVARLTKTPVCIHHTRIENKPIASANIITSRACASLEKLIGYASFYISHGTICLFHKGKNYITEIEDAKKTWHFDYTITPSVTDTSGVILTLRHIRERQHAQQQHQSQNQ